jgi:hypothetical protein
MKVDFKTMSIHELKTYVLANRHDDLAFHCLVDRLEAESTDSPLYPPPTTPENVAIMEAAMRERLAR